MADVSDNGAVSARHRLAAFLSERSGLFRDYLTAVSGSAGRLVFSLVYFVALANALSLADFGLFATASAAGVMLSRLLGFGFISALYRTATVRPNLIGTFTAGFIMMAILSLPLLIGASAVVYAVFFAGLTTPTIFGTVVAAEALLFRPVEAVMIVNNGSGRFGRAAVLAILSILLRAAAAAIFYFAADHSLETWTSFYFAANLACLLLAFAFFHPRQRLRLAPRLYWRRLADSVYTAGAEVLFYLQMEFDKLLVLSLGGPTLAGIYAILMRLVDLTAIPIRTFSMMLVQRIMRTPEMLARLKLKATIEAGIFIASTLAMLAMALMLHFYPTLLGRNVAEAAPLLMLALFVPALRNLVEYQAELLYARGQTLIRSLNLGLLAAMKAVILAAILASAAAPADLVMALNWGFALLYLCSAALTYSALRRPAKRV
jgi:O-antigen/teichoic acid export membrane protein